MTPLDRLRVAANVTDQSKDEQLAELLLQAKEYILAYTNRDELPESMRAGQIRLALLYYNRMGIEGESAHSEGGVSRSIDDLPMSMQAWLNSYRLTPDVARARRATSAAN